MQPTHISFATKLANYLKASYPLLWIKTHEEMRVVKDIIGAFDKTKTPIIIYSWDAQLELRKYKREGGGWEKVPGDTKVMNVINVCQKLGSSNERSLVIFKDFHSYIEAPGLIRAIRNAIEDLKSEGNMFIFVSPIIKIPVELEKEIQLLDFSLPDEPHLGLILESVNETVKKKYPNEPDKSSISADIRQGAIEAAKGMTYSETHDAFSLAIVENQKFDNNFVLSVFEEKVKQVKRHGLLQYLKPDVDFDNIGGLDGLKKWIRTRSKAYSEEARKYKLPFPKGVHSGGDSR